MEYGYLGFNSQLITIFVIFNVHFFYNWILEVVTSVALLVCSSEDGFQFTAAAHN